MLKTFKADIRLEVICNTKTSKIVIKANAKKEVIARELGAFLISQIGKGSNYTGTSRREEYRIVLELDLKNDDFRVSSNTETDGLRWMILLLALLELERSKISPI